MSDRHMEIRLAGQVIVPLTSSQALHRNELWMMGGRHRPFLCIPVPDRGDLTASKTMPREACMFVSPEGKEFVMIDTIGYEISVVGGEGGPNIGNLATVIDLDPYLVNATRRPGAVATKLKVHAGELSVWGAPRRARGDLSNAADQATARFSQDVSGILSWKLPPAAGNSYAILLQSGIERYVIDIGLDDYDVNPVVLTFAALCGWTGTSDEFIDFDGAEALYKDARFPDDIQYIVADTHPRTGACPPNKTTKV